MKPKESQCTSLSCLLQWSHLGSAKIQLAGRVNQTNCILLIWTNLITWNPREQEGCLLQHISCLYSSGVSCHIMFGDYWVFFSFQDHLWKRNIHTLDDKSVDIIQVYILALPIIPLHMLNAWKIIQDWFWTPLSWKR